MLASPADRVDPWRLAAQGRTLTGRVALDSLPRLAPALSGPGAVEYRLAFHLDDERRAALDGHVTATLVVQCQRCLEPLTIAVDSHFELAFVRGLDEVARLPESYEPALAENGWVRPADLVEDELLLALPPVPLHESTGCAAGGAAPPSGAQPGTTKVTNPFAALGVLRKRGKTEE
jgi:uncharacterized protein